jgi:hypothetical protein
MWLKLALQRLGDLGEAEESIQSVEFALSSDHSLHQALHQRILIRITKEALRSLAASVRPSEDEAEDGQQLILDLISSRAAESDKEFKRFWEQTMEFLWSYALKSIGEEHRQMNFKLLDLHPCFNDKCSSAVGKDPEATAMMLGNGGLQGFVF